jgi:hypothetical protein
MEKKVSDMILVVLFRKGFVTARTSRPDTFRAANLLLRHEDVFRAFIVVFSRLVVVRSLDFGFL